MVDELLTDDQEVDRAKRWLRENGAFLAAGVVLGLGGLFGWQQWQNYQLEQAGKASIIWEQMRAAINGDRFNEVAETLTLLETDYQGTPYLDQARLAAARMHMLNSEPESAAEQLRLLIDNTGDAGIKRIGKLRLAQVLLFQQQHEEALQILDADSSAFAGQFYDLRGDVYFAMGEMEEARDAYEAALNTVEQGVINRQYVQMKLDDTVARLAQIDSDEGAQADPTISDSSDASSNVTNTQEASSPSDE